MNTQNRQYTIIDMLILGWVGFVLLILIFVPLISYPFNDTASFITAIPRTFGDNPIISIILVLIIATYLGIGLMPGLRLLRVDLKQINKKASLASTLIAVFQLNRQNTVSDTARLGYALVATNIVLMVLIPVIGVESGDLLGTYNLLFFLGSVPVAILSALYSSFFKRMIANETVPNAPAPFVSVLSGRLIGAQPRLSRNEEFFIGRDNNAQLVLFDDVHANNYHACIYFDRNRPMLFAYHPMYMNQQAIQPQVAYTLNPGDILQVGQTIIQYEG
jgi:hypothetical protein